MKIQGSDGNSYFIQNTKCVYEADLSGRWDAPAFDPFIKSTVTLFVSVEKLFCHIVHNVIKKQKVEEYQWAAVHTGTFPLSHPHERKNSGHICCCTGAASYKFSCTVSKKGYKCD